MNLNLLKTYIRVVETQNLSRTAEDFGLSQPAVTKQIQTLEDMYGILLLERSGRKLRPTEAGETLYNCAREVVRSMDKLDKAMEEISESRKGNLYLGASTIPGQYILPRIIKGFKEKYPHISISLDIADTEKIFNKVSERELDIGIVGGWSNNRKVEGFPWLQDELVLIIPEQHPMAGQASVSLQDLLEERWIFREKGSGTRKAMEDLMAIYNVNREELNIYMETGSTEAVLAMVEAGMGVSIVSRWVIRPQGSAYKIKYLTLREDEARRMFYVALPRQKVRRKSVSNFLEYLQNWDEE
ncbi:Transcription regulator HTH, LysR [Syntrophomonas zehnderi OL-4]|uniref:Transcription regulator HTH, LysR n=1 Tax=Syntrophomonas zehnderi OL-4 TaxID=690567 RepID=A0A0E3W2V0_9FIRM|nr:selenium metabolism-associated LysR family transcriptional regulator [Syntrophomonas zehnderi]CFX22666.1 Transcription regulator HTH, LysR [Syntrophomonas zehnderi OL-4]